MNPVSPTPHPRAQGRVCVHECRGTHTTATTHVYTFTMEKRSSISPPHADGTKTLLFPPNPSKPMGGGEGRGNSHISNEQAKIPGLNVFAGGK